MTTALALNRGILPWNDCADQIEEGEVDDEDGVVVESRGSHWGSIRRNHDTIVSHRERRIGGDRSSQDYFCGRKRPRSPCSSEISSNRHASTLRAESEPCHVRLDPTASTSTSKHYSQRKMCNPNPNQANAASAPYRSKRNMQPCKVTPDFPPSRVEREPRMQSGNFIDHRREYRRKEPGHVRPRDWRPPQHDRRRREEFQQDQQPRFTRDRRDHSPPKGSMQYGELRNRRDQQTFRRTSGSDEGRVTLHTQRRNFRTPAEPQSRNSSSNRTLERTSSNIANQNRLADRCQSRDTHTSDQTGSESKLAPASSQRQPQPQPQPRLHSEQVRRQSHEATSRTFSSPPSARRQFRSCEGENSHSRHSGQFSRSYDVRSHIVDSEPHRSDQSKRKADRISATDRCDDLLTRNRIQRHVESNSRRTVNQVEPDEFRVEGAVISAAKEAESMFLAPLKKRRYEEKVENETDSRNIDLQTEAERTQVKTDCMNKLSPSTGRLGKRWSPPSRGVEKTESTTGRCLAEEDDVQSEQKLFEANRATISMTVDSKVPCSFHSTDSSSSRSNGDSLASHQVSTSAIHKEGSPMQNTRNVTSNPAFKAFHSSGTSGSSELASTVTSNKFMLSETPHTVGGVGKATSEQLGKKRYPLPHSGDVATTLQKSQQSHRIIPPPYTDTTSTLPNSTLESISSQSSQVVDGGDGSPLLRTEASRKLSRPVDSETTPKKTQQLDKISPPRQAAKLPVSTPGSSKSESSLRANGTAAPKKHPLDKKQACLPKTDISKSTSSKNQVSSTLKKPEVLGSKSATGIPTRWLKPAKRPPKKRPFMEDRAAKKAIKDSDVKFETAEISVGLNVLKETKKSQAAQQGIKPTKEGSEISSLSSDTKCMATKKLQRKLPAIDCYVEKADALFELSETGAPSTSLKVTKKLDDRQNLSIAPRTSPEVRTSLSSQSGKSKMIHERSSVDAVNKEEAACTDSPSINRAVTDSEGGSTVSNARESLTVEKQLEPRIPISIVAKVSGLKSNQPARDFVVDDNMLNGNSKTTRKNSEDATPDLATDDSLTDSTEERAPATNVPSVIVRKNQSKGDNAAYCFSMDSLSSVTETNTVDLDMSAKGRNDEHYKVVDAVSRHAMDKSGSSSESSSDESDTDEEEVMMWAAKMFGTAPRPIARPKAKSPEPKLGRYGQEQLYSKPTLQLRLPAENTDIVERAENAGKDDKIGKIEKTDNTKKPDKEVITVAKSFEKKDSERRPSGEADGIANGYRVDFPLKVRKRKKKKKYQIKLPNKPLKALNDIDREDTNELDLDRAEREREELRRKKESAKPLTAAQIRAIIAEDDGPASGSHNWVRRSVRQPSKSLLQSKQALSLFSKLRSNHEDMVVLKMKKYISDPDAPAVVLDAALDALEENSNCEALFIQNFNQGMRDKQVLQLTRILQAPTCKIWCLNIGETYNVTDDTWEIFTKGLKKTKVTHMYASEHTITTEMKDEIRGTIRKNRSKHDMHINPNNLDVIIQCTHCWWNPINAKVLRPYLRKRGYEFMLNDTEGQGLRGSSSAAPVK